MFLNFYKISRLSAMLGVALVLPAMGVFAEAPQVEESPSSAKQAHARPQVIYHLANGSRGTAEALHAQSKAADNMLDVSANMPISLQLARTNANTAAQVAAATSNDPAPSPEVNVGSKDERHVSRRAVVRGSSHGRSSQKHGSAGASGHRSGKGGGKKR